MNLPDIKSPPRKYTIVLSALLLLAGIFIFNHSAASSHQKFATQTTEYLQSATYSAEGVKYQALSHVTGKRVSAISKLFCKPNFSLLHSEAVPVQLKSSLQTALNKPFLCSFCSIKSIPQSGKNDLPTASA